MESLTYLALIWGLVFIANVLALYPKMLPVLWFLALGSLLANVGVINGDGDQFISVLANLGIILIMFALGFEENVDNFMSSIKKSWGIALFGAIAPFTAAYHVADYFWVNANISLVCGLTLTVLLLSLLVGCLPSNLVSIRQFVPIWLD